MYASWCPQLVSKPGFVDDSWILTTCQRKQVGEQIWGLFSIMLSEYTIFNTRLHKAPWATFGRVLRSVLRVPYILETASLPGCKRVHERRATMLCLSALVAYMCRVLSSPHLVFFGRRLTDTCWKAGFCSSGCDLGKHSSRDFGSCILNSELAFVVQSPERTTLCAKTGDFRIRVLCVAKLSNAMRKPAFCSIVPLNLQGCPCNLRRPNSVLNPASRTQRLRRAQALGL